MQISIKSKKNPTINSDQLIVIIMSRHLRKSILFYIFSFLIGYFIYLLFKCYPPFQLPLHNPLSPLPFPCLYEGAPWPTHSLLLQHSSIPLLWQHPQDQGTPLPVMPDKVIFCHIFSWSHVSLNVYVLFCWQFSPWELWGGRGLVVWYCCSSYEVANSFSSFSLCPNFSIGVPALSQMFSSVQSHLYWSGSGRDSQRTSIPGSSQQALFGIGNSVWVWCLQLGWIPRWAVSGWPYHQSLLHSLSLHFLLTGEILD